MSLWGVDSTVTAFDCERSTLSGKLRISIALATAAMLVGVAASGGCVGAPQPGGVCDGSAACGEAAAGDDAGAAVPVPVADAAQPTPVNDPVEGDLGVGSGVAGDGGVPALVWLPWLGWGNTIDLLDLLATGGLDGAMESATDNPGSFTHLELLCLDQGLPPSHCRSRYGGP